jgi:hypothetical protein
MGGSGVGTTAVQIRTPGCGSNRPASGRREDNPSVTPGRSDSLCQRTAGVACSKYTCSSAVSWQEHLR